jgi:uncharacterized protein YbjT (DUF2867 family)
MKISSKRDKIILVTGATGNQGSAVTNSLIASGWRMRALVRDATKLPVRIATSKNIDIVRGDLEDRGSLDRAVQGVYGVFAVHTWREKGVEGEVRMGRNLADAAKAAGVKHYIYSSAAGANGGTGVPILDSKCRIEQHILKARLPSTIFRPTLFMYNFNAPELRSSIQKGTLSLPFKPDLPLQMIAAEDLGAFVSMAFEDPLHYLGKIIELAGDELTLLEAAEVFGRTLGRPVSFAEQPMEQVRSFSEDLALLYEWFNTHKINTDIKALRSLHPRLMALEQWLKRTASWLNAA